MFTDHTAQVSSFWWKARTAHPELCISRYADWPSEVTDTDDHGNGGLYLATRKGTILPSQDSYEKLSYHHIQP